MKKKLPMFHPGEIALISKANIRPDLIGMKAKIIQHPTQRMMLRPDGDKEIQDVYICTIKGFGDTLFGFSESALSKSYKACDWRDLTADGRIIWSPSKA